MICCGGSNYLFVGKKLKCLFSPFLAGLVMPFHSLFQMPEAANCTWWTQHAKHLWREWCCLCKFHYTLSFVITSTDCFDWLWGGFVSPLQLTEHMHIAYDNTRRCNHMPYLAEYGISVMMHAFSCNWYVSYYKMRNSRL